MRSAIVACIALAMLLTQLVMTSGHVHLQDSHHAARSQTEAWHWPVVPQRHDHPLHDESQCAVCWAQAAAGCALMPPATPLRQTAGLGVPQPCAAVQARISQPIASAFRSRAPPASASDGAAGRIRA
jgi:hypothetical protein